MDLLLGTQQHMMRIKRFFEKLWVWVKEVEVNFKDDLLLGKGYYGLTAWDRAAGLGKKELLAKLWGWGK